VQEAATWAAPWPARQPSNTGRDVAGTINGEPATGNGQWLTGDEGNENTAGLMLRIMSTTTGDKGAVYISKGMGTRLMHYIEGATGDVNGSLTIAQQAIADRIDAEIQKLNDRVDAYIQQLQREFVAMEQTIARMQNLGTWLTQQIQILTNMNKQNQ